MGKNIGKTDTNCTWELQEYHAQGHFNVIYALIRRHPKKTRQKSPSAVMKVRAKIQALLFEALSR